MDTNERIAAFLDQTRFAVAGASTDRSKYGNKCLRCYLQHDRDVVALNPKAAEVEGVAAFPSLAQAPDGIEAVTIVTPPGITERVVEDMARLGIRHVWMQPGAESEAAVARAVGLGMNVIAGGPCLLVALGFNDAASPEGRPSQ